MKKNCNSCSIEWCVFNGYMPITFLPINLRIQSHPLYSPIYRRMEENRIPKRVLCMNLETTRPRGRPRNRWQHKVREDGSIVGGEEWQEKVYDREEWKKLLRTARNHRILHMPMEWMYIEYCCIPKINSVQLDQANYTVWTIIILVSSILWIPAHSLHKMLMVYIRPELTIIFYDKIYFLPQYHNTE